ncbi:MAG: hypothetical protein QOG41_1236 [Thermoleophilaceae bacterium]|nr:hypothetical protein [Thermoleophilaceae bacterium]
MRNRALHDALREFALETAALLSTELDAGEELPYDVVEEPGTGSVLYRYLPLTADFIAARWDVIAATASAKRAAQALGNGAEAYLRLRGLPSADDAEPALRAMLDRLYEDATDFQFPEERFDRVYSEVERTLYEGTMHTAVVAAVQGLILESDRVDLGGGLMLARGDRIDAPPEAVWPLGPGERERAAGPNAVCALERDIETDAPLPATEARIRFRRLLTAMRLFKPGRVALAGFGWGRADGGVWQPVPLAVGGPGRGEPWVLSEAEEPELRELVELIAGSRHAGRIGWSLGRFEMGCERSTDIEALSDNLLAIQSLLDADGDAGRASLAQRLAALCAEESERRVVRGRLEAAFAIERRAMAGGAIDFDVDDEEDDVGEQPSPRALCADVEQHVRALLRDVVCGYLDHDLRSVADDILIAGDEPIDIRARDLREEEEPQEALDYEPEPEPELDLEQERDHPAINAASRLPDGPGTAADPRSAAWAVAALPGPRTFREADPPRFEDRVEIEVYGEPTIADEPLPVEEPAPDAEGTVPLTMPFAHEASAGAESDVKGTVPLTNEEELESGVTASADWDFDDDPASYSAPI